MRNALPTGVVFHLQRDFRCCLTTPGAAHRARPVADATRTIRMTAATAHQQTLNPSPVIVPKTLGAVIVPKMLGSAILLAASAARGDPRGALPPETRRPMVAVGSVSATSATVLILTWAAGILIHL